jgi:hypothetical protein
MKQIPYDIAKSFMFRALSAILRENESGDGVPCISLSEALAALRHWADANRQDYDHADTIGIDLYRENCRCDDDNSEGNLLPALADWIADYHGEWLKPELRVRLERIHARMADSDYFDTPESGADLAWLKGLKAGLDRHAEDSSTPEAS